MYAAINGRLITNQRSTDEALTAPRNFTRQPGLCVTPLPHSVLRRDLHRNSSVKGLADRNIAVLRYQLSEVTGVGSSPRQFDQSL